MWRSTVRTDGCVYLGSKTEIAQWFETLQDGLDIMGAV